jgi:DNA-binding MarR family transcriptional regulator
VIWGTGEGEGGSGVGGVRVGTASARALVVVGTGPRHLRMNNVFFGLKRAYHGTLRVTRRALARIGLTAARFDLLHILEKAGGEMPQRELQRALGVAASTVSRMLSSLQELGLVEREIMLEDHRRSWVELTHAGRRCIGRAVRIFIHSGWVQLAVDSALCPERWYSETTCLLASAACKRTLGRLRHSFGDLATRDYPRTPEYVPPDPDRVWSAFMARSKP